MARTTRPALVAPLTTWSTATSRRCIAAGFAARWVEQTARSRLRADQMSHSHSATGKHRGRLAVVFVITLVVFIFELVGGVVTNSLALIADAGHVFTDVVGVGLALGAIWIAERPPTDERTFGFYRAEILAAVVNALLLFGVAAYILVEAWRRLMEPPEIATGLMLVVAVIGGLANLVSLFILRQAQADSLNMRGAYLEVSAGIDCYPTRRRTRRADQAVRLVRPRFSPWALLPILDESRGPRLSPARTSAARPASASTGSVA